MKAGYEKGLHIEPKAKKGEARSPWQANSKMELQEARKLYMTPTYRLLVKYIG